MRQLKIEVVSIGDIKPHPRNSRVHSEAQIAQLVRSLETFGWVKPIVVDEKDMVVAGHGMLLAATARGDKKVPIIRVKDLTAQQRRAYMIADNKLAANSDWDTSILADELRGLSGEDFDILLTGFSKGELEKMLSEEDEAPEDFDEKDETVPTKHKCPKCGYVWSGEQSLVDDE